MADVCGAVAGTTTAPCAVRKTSRTLTKPPGQKWRSAFASGASKPGTGLADTDTFHRIDPAIVRKEVEAAGFKFAGESKVLNNPADPLDIAVFDKSIRGHTSQFAYKFVKPN